MLRARAYISETMSLTKQSATPSGENNHASAPVVIIGAGMAGLSAARELESRKIPVIVLDKGRGVGGRMATRRGEEAHFDHGAQFFTARSEIFRRRVDDWVHRGIATLWTVGFPPSLDAARAAWELGGDTPSSSAGGSQSRASGAQHPRYRGNPGMTAPAKDMAQGLDVRVGTRVSQVRTAGDGGPDGPLEVVTEDGTVFGAAALILTPPVPQSVALLEAGGVASADTRIPEGAGESSSERRLGDIVYDKCLVLLARFDGSPQSGAATEGPEPLIPPPGAVRKPSDTIDWIADNGVKGISPKPGALTVHFSPTFSEQYYEADDEAVAAAMIPELRALLGVEPTEYQVKRWRYSKPRKALRTEAAALPHEPRIVLAGDAFAGARVEGAFLSGLRAAALVRDVESVGWSDA